VEAAEGVQLALQKRVDEAEAAGDTALAAARAAEAEMRRLADMYQDMQAHALEQSSQSDMKAAQKEAQATALLAAARQNTAFWEDEAARRAGDLSLLRVEKDASIASLRARMAMTEQASRVQTHELSMRLGAQVQTVEHANHLTQVILSLSLCIHSLSLSLSLSLSRARSLSRSWS
jgi:hypothetical protein